jgi:xylulokinase
VVEGVSYSQQDGLEIIENLGVPVNSVRASGGGANSPFWRQILADVFNKPVVTLESQEGSAYGAALLGMVATGAFSSVPEACRVAVREVDTVLPRAGAVSVYASGHKTYQKLYPVLRSAI